MQKLDRVGYTYERNLQAIYHHVSNRGICIDRGRIKEALDFVNAEILTNLAIASSQWNLQVYLGKDNKPSNGANSVNINSSSGEKSLLCALQNLGYQVPKIRKKNDEGEYEHKYSTGELALQKMLAVNQFGYGGGDPAIRSVLAIREMGKLKSSYLNASLYTDSSGNSFYLSSYNVSGTFTGRRSSSKHRYGFGNNGQNFPKHGKLAKKFRRCLKARPGNIFLMVDQKGAEEWPVQALAENHEALSDMRAGINRHINRAAFIFSIPVDTRTEGEWKDSLEYYLGKKAGHANNYGMQFLRLSETLAQEGYSIPAPSCQKMLQRLNIMEPQTDSVFHKYVKDQVNSTRQLSNPFGREFLFLGLRPNDNNYKIFNDAYSTIPQSTVGDNTGLAVTCLECFSSLPLVERLIVQEGHDSIVQDIPDSCDVIARSLHDTVDSFDRDICFHNGISVNIPVEAEIGYDFADTVKLKDLSYEGIEDARAKLRAKLQLD